MLTLPRCKWHCQVPGKISKTYQNLDILQANDFTGCLLTTLHSCISCNRIRHIYKVTYVFTRVWISTVRWGSTTVKSLTHSLAKNMELFQKKLSAYTNWHFNTWITFSGEGNEGGEDGRGTEVEGQMREMEGWVREGTESEEREGTGEMREMEEGGEWGRGMSFYSLCPQWPGI